MTDDGNITQLSEHSALRKDPLTTLPGVSWSEQLLIRVHRYYSYDAGETLSQAAVFLKAMDQPEKNSTSCTKKDAALKEAAIALTTWQHIHAPELCNLKLVRQSRWRLNQGTLTFIAKTQQTIQDALNSGDEED
jgi:hypothetical protein